mgnify:CR=1 FL=1
MRGYFGIGVEKLSKAQNAGSLFEFEDWQGLRLPVGCELVGVELTDDAIELPSFRHPLSAAYILGPERGSLSPEVTALCEFVVKIPTKFCVNVGLAGAIVMYDRTISVGRFADRPETPGGPTEPLAPVTFGPPLWVRKKKRREAAAARAAAEAGE